MIYGWMLWVWGLALLAGVTAYFVLRRLRRIRRKPSGLAVANTQLLTRLPQYRTLMRRYRRLVGLMGLAALLLLASGIAMSVRPASSSPRAEDDKQNRDIVFCLDVSGSMEDSDAKIADALVVLAGQLKGQRVGLTIFSAGAVVKFPLTDDASYVRAQLENAHRKLASSDPMYSAGTIVSTETVGTWVGDGLMTCVRQFDQLSQRRARSVVIATDNATAKAETYTVPQAAAEAQRAGIRIYAFMPFELVTGSPDLAQMQSITASTGGEVYPTDDSSSVTGAAQQILAQEAARLKTPPVLTRVDHPRIPFVVALAAVAVLLLAAWRVER